MIPPRPGAADEADEATAEPASPPSSPPGALPFGARCGAHPEANASALCSRCGDFLCSACVTESDPVLCARCEPHGAEPFPFEDREERGFLPALIETLTGVLAHPRTTFRKRFRARGVGSALLYGLLLSTPVTWVLGGLELAFPSADRIASRSDPAIRQMGLEVLFSDAFQLGTMLASPLLFVFGLYMSAAAYFLGLRIVGAGKQPFGHVVRTLAYVQGSFGPISLVGGIPVIGAVLSFGMLGWSLVVSFIALAEVHRTSVLRVIGAFALVVVLFTAISCLVGIAIAVPLALSSDIPL